MRKKFILHIFSRKSSILHFTINSSFSDRFLLSFLIVADKFFATWLIVIRR